MSRIQTGSLKCSSWQANITASESELQGAGAACFRLIFITQTCQAVKAVELHEGRCHKAGATS
eukprot:351831-Chlamydomonas_euryale.AAC.4